MENRSNKTHLCSVIWNFVTRSQDGNTASCNECKDGGKTRNGHELHMPGRYINLDVVDSSFINIYCRHGVTFPNFSIRRHLTNVHKISLKDVVYDDTNPGPNKRIGYREYKLDCPFCGKNFEAINLRAHWRLFLIFCYVNFD
jgi:hypothetical protein